MFQLLQTALMVEHSDNPPQLTRIKGNNYVF